MGIMDAYENEPTEQTAPSGDPIIFAVKKDTGSMLRNVQACFPQWEETMAMHNLLSVATHDLKKFSNESTQALVAVAMAVGQHADSLGHSYVSLEFCEDEEFKALVRSFAACEHLIGKDAKSLAAQRAAIAAVTVVENRSEIQA